MIVHSVTKSEHSTVVRNLTKVWKMETGPLRGAKYCLEGCKNTLYIFEEKCSLKNTLFNVLPYEQAS